MSDGVREEQKREQIKEMGSVDLEGSKNRHKIKLLTVIGEIEGHEAVSGNAKATKYEHLLPLLAEVEDSDEIEGLLILLHWSQWTDEGSVYIRLSWQKALRQSKRHRRSKVRSPTFGKHFCQVW